jgi:hypothetical protein
VSRGKVYLRYGCTARVKDLRVRVRKCGSGYKRAELVDGVVWQWLKTLLTDETALDEALTVYQTERESAVAPLRERLAAVDGLLADNRRQFTKVLDLYLTYDFPREVLIERKTRLQKTIVVLEAERGCLVTQIEAQALTKEQMRSLRDFTAEIRNGVEEADGSFAARQKLVALLEVRGIIGVEDGQDVIHLNCILGENKLCLTSTDC